MVTWNMWSGEKLCLNVFSLGVFKHLASTVPCVYTAFQSNMG